MNITYLIGNGFDLNLGLRTRYTDFYDYYLNNTESDTENISKLKASIREYMEDKNPDKINWSDFELGFGIYTGKLPNTENADAIIHECHTDICVNLSKYLKKEQQRFSAEYIKNDKKIIEELSKSFLQYDRGLKNDDKSLINQYADKYTGGTSINIIDFNYNYVLDSIFECVKEAGLLGYRLHGGTNYPNTLKEIIHIHGTVDRGLTFGVNDNSQINEDIFSDEEIERKNELIKTQFLQYMGEGTNDHALNIIANSNIVYIYGMSLGATDKRIWQAIIDRMKVINNMILIIYDYSCPVIGLKPTDYIKYCRVKRNEFLMNSKEDRKSLDSVYNRIFITPGNIFECITGIVNNQQPVVTNG